MANESAISNNPKKNRNYTLLPIIIFVIIVCVSAIIPLPGNMTREILVVSTVWLGVILLWIMESLPLAISGFMGCFLLYLFGTLNGWSILKENAFSGFAEVTVWFVFAGLIIGLATHKSGVARIISNYIIQRVGGTFQRVLAGYMVVLLVITYMVPSGDAVTVIMCTLAVGIVASMRCGPTSNIGKILFLVPAIAAGVFNKAVLHGASAIVAAGMIEKFSGRPIGFTSWFIYMLPAQVFLFFWVYFLIQVIFKPEAISTFRVIKTQDKEEFGPLQKRASFWLGLALTLWFTDKLTGIRPDLICMGAAIGMMLPGIGVLTVKELREELNWLVAIFLGTAFSLVNTLEAAGLFKIVSDNVLYRIPADLPLYQTILIIALLALSLHLLSGHTSMLVASVLPVIIKWGTEHNLSVVALTFAFLWGASGEFLVYQSGAFMIAYAYGYFSVFDLMKAGLLMIVGIMISLVIMDLFWWPLIGF